MAPLSGLGAAQADGAAGNQSYVAVQDGECTPITSFASNESVIEYYDYRLPSQFDDNPYVNATGSAFGSEGTIDLQEADTSIVFLYTDTTDDSQYLVLVHGEEANDNSSGGAATFEISGLPEDGEWVIRDDDYNDTTSIDSWNVTDTESTVDWAWSDAATDGGVYSEIDNETSVTIAPAFNEAAALFGENGNGTVEAWQVLSNETTTTDNVTEDVTRTDLDLNESLQIAAGTCADGGIADGNETADNETADNDTATVEFSFQESDGTNVTVDEVTIPRDGYVAIHNDSLQDGNVVGSVIGVSEYLEAGQYENLTVELFDVPGADFDESELNENEVIIAMPHEETTGDESYDFVSSNGTDDGPYTADGEPVTDVDLVLAPDDATDDDNVTETPDDDNVTETPDDTATDDSDTSGPLVPLPE